MPTAPANRDTTPKRTPSHPADAGAAKKAARPPRAPAWKCPRCGTRKRLRGDRHA